MIEFVYIFSVGSRRHKIGVSRNPRRRLAEVQTGSPDPVVFSVHAECERAYEVEGVCHRILDHRRLSGEWFYAELGEVEHVLDRAWLEVFGRLPALKPQMAEFQRQARRYGYAYEPVFAGPADVPEAEPASPPGDRERWIAELQARIADLEAEAAALRADAAVTHSRREANRLRMATARTVFKQPGPA